MQKQSVLFAGISLALMLVIIQPAFAQYDVSEKGLSRNEGL